MNHTGIDKVTYGVADIEKGAQLMLNALVRLST